MPGNDLLKTTMRENNQSLTAVRLTIFDYLSVCESQTMAELVHKMDGKADRASVYRTIKLFERLGIVQRVHTGWKHTLELSDRFTPHHHHLNCISCSRHLPVTESSGLESNILRLCRANNFTPTNHQLEIRGYCQDCQHTRPEGLK